MRTSGLLVVALYAVYLSTLAFRPCKEAFLDLALGLRWKHRNRTRRNYLNAHPQDATTEDLRVLILDNEPARRHTNQERMLLTNPPHTAPVAWQWIRSNGLHSYFDMCHAGFSDTELITHLDTGTQPPPEVVRMLVALTHARHDHPSTPTHEP